MTKIVVLFLYILCETSKQAFCANVVHFLKRRFLHRSHPDFVHFLQTLLFMVENMYLFTFLLHCLIIEKVYFRNSKTHYKMIAFGPHEQKTRNKCPRSVFLYSAFCLPTFPVVSASGCFFGPLLARSLSKISKSRFV